MIYHFLKRDFISNKINWLINFIIIATCCTGALWYSEILSVLGVVLLFFAIIPLQSLTGAAWRSQHVMSRNYLLSLPVPRKKMFLIVQTRALVFAIPALIYALAMPFYSPFFASVVLPDRAYYGLYALMLLMALVWMINSAIYANLIFEKITTYLTKIERTQSWTVYMGLFFCELALVFYCFFTAGQGLLSTVIGFTLLLAVAAQRFHKTQKNWMGR